MSDQWHPGLGECLRKKRKKEKGRKLRSKLIIEAILWARKRSRNQVIQHLEMKERESRRI